MVPVPLVGRPRVRVDVRLVRIEVRRQAARPARSASCAKLPITSISRGIGVVHPHRQRRAPVAVARDRPVHVVRQPLAEPPGARSPAGFQFTSRVARQHRLAHVGGADEPACARVVQQRRVAAPAVRIACRNFCAFHSTPRRSSSSMMSAVGVLHEQAAHQRRARRRTRRATSPAARTRARAAGRRRSRRRRTPAPCAPRRCRRRP